MVCIVLLMHGWREHGYLSLNTFATIVISAVGDVILVRRGRGDLQFDVGKILLIMPVITINL